MFARECLRLFRIGILQRRRPFGPQPDVRIGPVQMAVERAIDREAPQQVALALAEGIELLAVRGVLLALAQELHIEQTEETQLERRDALVLHEFGGAQFFDLALHLR